MSMTKSKIELLELKEKKSMNGNHQSTDIIPLINKAWNDSFAQVKKKKQAIAERGWYPLNRNILLNDELRSTMTPAEV